jgi:hypothetical protein
MDKINDYCFHSVNFVYLCMQEEIMSKIQNTIYVMFGSLGEAEFCITPV